MTTSITVFAFVNLGPAKDSAGERPPTAAGLNHLAYTWRNIEELIDTYSSTTVAYLL
jgi:hypothetical protein